MPSKVVLRRLQDAFPQIDLRLLKAVSIEHAEDVDAAFEFIVSDVLPRFSEPPKDTQENKDSPHKAGSSSLDFPRDGINNSDASQLSEMKSVAFERTLYDNPSSYHASLSMEEAITRGSHASERNIPSFLTNYHRAIANVDSGMHLEQGSAEYEVPLISNHKIGTLHCISGVLGETQPVGSLSNLYGGNNHDHLFFGAEIGTTSLKDGIVMQTQDSNSLNDAFQESDHVSGKGAVSSILSTASDDELSALENNSVILVSEAFSEKDINESMLGSEELTSCSVVPANIRDFDEYKFADKNAFASAREDSPCVLEDHINSVKCVDSVVYEFGCSSGIQEFQPKHMVENAVDLQPPSNDDCQTTNLSTRSSQIVSIDFLEDFIADEKNNKKILMSAMESTIDMMKDVELEEERAKQVKEEASKCGEDILIKVEELRQRLKDAKEANDMHAGEVYGEKSILATEARELQSRLLSLSNERDKSFTIIKEIQETLEARVAAAKNEIAAAEQEKLEKERLAQKALGEQEQLMDTIVQESMKLQQEADENSKLREFLMDRGRIVDVLQGEIAVICEDVLSLKERVDGRIPLSRSSSSRPGSLASSLSSSASYRSSSSLRISPSVELKENPSSLATSQQLFKSQELKNSKSSDKIIPGDKQAMDSDWEFFESPVMN
ncbi:hypothetical protein J5N97_015116 [Dioscorea zingiberensis]|uniref:CUE domain-containing protein n=1 Tax=Dioscorea zingiberensis TaxID=325984 RepID=A0A9D5CV84_9LILI|nr:hypothetical protein J5N97_015116 [Dioscorea zingiberensis]